MSKDVTLAKNKDDIHKKGTAFFLGDDFMAKLGRMTYRKDYHVLSKVIEDFYGDITLNEDQTELLLKEIKTFLKNESFDGQMKIWLSVLVALCEDALRYKLNLYFNAD